MIGGIGYAVGGSFDPRGVVGTGAEALDFPSSVQPESDRERQSAPAAVTTMDSLIGFTKKGGCIKGNAPRGEEHILHEPRTQTHAHKEFNCRTQYRERRRFKFQAGGSCRQTPGSYFPEAHPGAALRRKARHNPRRPTRRSQSTYSVRNRKDDADYLSTRRVYRRSGIS